MNARRPTVLACALALGACTIPANRDEDLGRTSAALVTLLVEAEGSSGGGTIESDAAASGGQVLRFDVVGARAEKPFTADTSTASAVVRARGIAGCAGSQFLTVLIDGDPVATQQVSASWQDYALPLRGLAGAHTMAFHYRKGSNACPLRVDVATFSLNDPPPPPPPPPPPVVVEAETATGPGIVVSDPSASAGKYLSLTTPSSLQTATFVTTSTMVSAKIRARRGTCAASPLLTVRIDGYDLGTQTIGATSWTDYPFTAMPSNVAGSHAIDFYYRYGSYGCALDIDVATIALQ